MIIIGVTGSIGMGKTTVCSMLRFLKIPVFDSDQQVRKILNTNNQIIKQIIEIWPETKCFIKSQKKINKVILANIIFKDKKNREILEKLIHPIVGEKRDNFIKDHLNSYIIALDVPLLYETGNDAICNYVFLVNAKKSIQKKRVMLRPNMTEEKFDLINKAQWSYEKKKMKRPIIIDTSYGKLFSFIFTLYSLLGIILSEKVKPH